MSVPWLGFTGFTLVFSALFTNLIRITRIIRDGFGHLELSTGETVSILLALETINTIDIVGSNAVLRQKHRTDARPLSFQLTESASLKIRGDSSAHCWALTCWS